MKQPQNDTKQKDKHSISSARQEGKKDNEEEKGLISRACLACGVRARRGKAERRSICGHINQFQSFQANQNQSPQDLIDTKIDSFPSAQLSSPIPQPSQPARAAGNQSCPCTTMRSHESCKGVASEQPRVRSFCLDKRDEWNGHGQTIPGNYRSLACFTSSVCPFRADGRNAAARRGGAVGFPFP